MSIIDKTYFYGIIEVPTDNVSRTNKLQIYIDSAQKTYLKYALGYELYKLFVAELPTPTSQRFTDILDGADFTNETTSKLDHWDGLVNTELKSFLADFAYFEYEEGVYITESSNGTTASNFENSDRVIPNPKQVAAYNRGHEQYYKLYDFLKANEDDYPEWDFTILKPANFLNI
jgi:hypothetical protein